MWASPWHLIHLPQEEKLLAQLIRDLGNRGRMFYAWQHGRGSHQKMPKEQELMQLPGRGDLDFCPLSEALANPRCGVHVPAIG